MDKLKAMGTFVQIAADGSLTAAARSLGMSLPSVVRQLADLESHLGVRLFNRTTRRISLTEEGRHYLERSSDILRAIAEAEGALTVGASEPSGSLTITAPVPFGQLYVAPAVTRFVKRYDSVRCRLRLSDRTLDLLEEGIDVGIRISHLEDSSLVAQQVARVRRMVVASPEYLQKQGVPEHPRDLLKGNCVCLFGRALPWSFIDGDSQFSVPVTGNLYFNQVFPAIEACLDGLGFGVFMSYQVATHLRSGRLTAVLADFELPPRPISIVYPHARLLPARTRIFIDWMKQDLTSVIDSF